MPPSQSSLFSGVSSQSSFLHHRCPQQYQYSLLASATSTNAMLPPLSPHRTILVASETNAEPHEFQVSGWRSAACRLAQLTYSLHYLRIDVLNTLRKLRFLSTPAPLSPAFLCIRFSVMSVAVCGIELRSSLMTFVSLAWLLFPVFIGIAHANVTHQSSRPLFSRPGPALPCSRQAALPSCR